MRSAPSSRGCVWQGNRCFFPHTSAQAPGWLPTGKDNFYAGAAARLEPGMPAGLPRLQTWEGGGQSAANWPQQLSSSSAGSRTHAHPFPGKSGVHQAHSLLGGWKTLPGETRRGRLCTEHPHVPMGMPPRALPRSHGNTAQGSPMLLSSGFGATLWLPSFWHSAPCSHGRLA